MKNYKNGIVYQIYPKSFHDSNGDGIGDIQGIISKLDYLEELGVDYIWLNPFYLSPQYDNGYDIADYYQIESMYGTMADVEELIKEANKRNMKLMLDLAFNHTSTQHAWFQKALQGDPQYMEYYFFRPGKQNNPPTNWSSKFGGSAWEYVKELGLYYLHLFDKTQADLNWDNPAVRKEIHQIVNFWLAKGVKGFRLDVINLISKPTVFEDDWDGDGRRFYTDGPRIHEFLKELNQATFGRYPDIVTVGEMSSTTIDHCLRYSNPEEKELTMVFNFHHLKMDYHNGDKWSLMPLDFISLKNNLASWQMAMSDYHGWSACFWCNHDQPRIVSRYGNDKEYRNASAKMLATAMHLLRGTPYVYQGEEIGMTNANFTALDEYRDVESLNYFNILAQKGLSEDEIYEILAARSRDNARTPMQWSNQIHAGFGLTTPWIKANENYQQINVCDSVQDENSIYHYYKKLIQLRKQWLIIQEGSFHLLLEDHPQVFAFERRIRNQSLIVINHFFADSITIEMPISPLGYRCILSNYEEQAMQSTLHLHPYESLVFLKE